MDCHNEWELRTKAAVQWLRNSIAATVGQGSSHSWHPLLGWNKPYPETTGYIIPTLFDYAELHQQALHRKLAMGCALWLCSIQLPSGAFTGLLLGNTQPSIFNSCQILFGLTRALQEDPANPDILQALQRCVRWLLSMQEQDGSWKRHGFVPGFTPTYYTHAVFGVLQANRALLQDEVHIKMQNALNYYGKRFQGHHPIRDWGFKPGKPAFTHTIAYTLTGFLESSIMLQDKAIFQKTVAVADQLLQVRQKACGRTAGRYAMDWSGDYSFVCVVGNAQLSILYHRLFELSGIKKYKLASASLLLEILESQKLSGNPNRVGGLPGSIPFWGPYLPFRYPNWAAKFFLDAMMPFKNENDWLKQ